MGTLTAVELVSTAPAIEWQGTGNPHRMRLQPMATVTSEAQAAIPESIGMPHITGGAHSVHTQGPCSPKTGLGTGRPDTLSDKR